MKVRGWMPPAATVAAALALTAAGYAADAAFSAAEIFTADNAALIYRDCTDAREAADFLAKHAATVTPNEAVGAQRFFIDCMNVKRAIADRDRTRYLYLAAAAAAYLEAQHAAGDEPRAAAIERGETYLSRIIPRAGRAGMVATYVPRPANAGGVPPGQTPRDAQPMRQTVQPGVVMLGARPNWRFGTMAQALNDAYDALLRPAPAATTAGK